MFEKLCTVFKSNEKSVLTSNFENPEKSKNVVFGDKLSFRYKDFESEFLDPYYLKDNIFSSYDKVFRDVDSLLFESSNIKCNICILNPMFIGREYSKSCSFKTIYKGEDKEAVFEVLSGKGFFVIESIGAKEKSVKVVKVKKASYVVVPKGYAFTIINSSEDERLVCMSLLGKNTEFQRCVLSKNNGASLFYTRSGFLLNKNIPSSLKLEDYDDNFLLDYSFSHDRGLYEQFLDLPEKFNFLKN